MKTIIVIGKQASLAAALRPILEPEGYRLLQQGDMWSAEPLIRQGMVDACIIDADLTSVRPLQSIEQFRRMAPGCPILIYTNEKQWEYEEDAYLLGVSHVLPKPVRSRLLLTLMSRLFNNQAPRPALPLPAPVANEPRSRESVCSPRPTLEVLRNFSEILSHSLCYKSLLKQFLLLLREVIGVNRATLFLRSKPNCLTLASEAMTDRRLHVACGIGIGPSLLEHFELSLDSGIGGFVFRYGRILRSSSDDARSEREIQKEFELLGGQVAIPILDRESIIGVAVFDGRLTGELFTNEELELIFHLLEQLGMAIKNSWLHDQLVASYEMMTDVINQLSGGCVVVGRDLEILHANRSARSIFFPNGGNQQGIEFPELPQVLAGKIFEVLKTGESITPFKHRPDANSDTILEVNIRPFRRETSRGTTAVLMLVEDISGEERAHKLEIETANLRLIQKIATQLAHEIGNAVVPLSTYQQLLEEKYGDPDFRNSLSTTMSDGVKRISRLSLQLLYLAQELTIKENIVVSSMLEAAFTDAQANLNLPEKVGQLSIEPASDLSLCQGNLRALRHALSELFLNALQGNSKDPQIRVNLVHEVSGSAKNVLRIEIRDNGAGFPKEAIQNLFRPFFTTRNVGLGLGLAAAKTIIEQHHGKIEVPASATPGKGMVIVSLPMIPNPAVSQNTSFFKTNLAQKSPFN